MELDWMPVIFVELVGYYERNDDVVCKRCDVVMNKSTIGFKGGCNPVPFEYEIVNKNYN